MSFVTRQAKNFARKILGRNTSFEPPSITSEPLKDFFTQANIKILDVGARGGPPSEWNVFAPFSHLFMCEPDYKEAQQLEKKFSNASIWPRVTVIPEALGSVRGKAMLNLTRYPGLSSLLEPNTSMIRDYFPSYEVFKKESREAWEVAEKKEIFLISLDEAAEKYGCCDLTFLKLDTQGTELDILRSGAERVLPDTVGVYVEVEFVPLYKAQPLFSQVHKFLEEEGFRLIDLKRTYSRRAPLKLFPAYSRPEIVYAHAFYLREKNKDTTSLPPLMRQRTICTAVALGYFDYALSLLRSETREGFKIIENAIIDYADYYWRSLRKARGRKTVGKYLAHGFQDKLWEV